MTRADIDELKIVIEADNKEAVSSLDDVIKKLEALDSSASSTQLKETGEALANLGQKVSGGFSRVDKTLKEVAGTTEVVDNKLKKVGEKSGFKKTGDDIKTVTDNTKEAVKSAEMLSEVYGKINFGNITGEGAKSTQFGEGVYGKINFGSVSNELPKAFDAGRQAIQGFTWGTVTAQRNLSILDKLAQKTIVTMEGLGGKVRSLGVSAVKTSSKLLMFPFAQLAKGAKKFGGAISKLFTKLKTVAMYRALRGFIKMINEGFKEGTQNAYQWSKLMNNLPQGDLGQYARTLDSLSSSALYLKNAFATMAIPILNRLEPAITKLIAKFVDAINVVNKFFATLLGRETWTKALYYPKEFAEGLDQATGSAKDLKDAITILGIDEINPLNAVKEPSGGSGGLEDALNYAEMFEEVITETDNKFSGFFEPFERAWQTKGQGVVDSIRNAMDGVGSLVGSIGKSFWDVWTNGTGQKAVEHILGIFTGISDTIGNISRQLSIGWDFNGNGTRLVQAFADTLNDILAMWEDIATTTAEWASNLDFRPIIDALADLAEGIEAVIDPITRAISWTWENVVLVLGKWCIEKGLPKAVSALAEALEAIGGALTGIGNAGSSKGGSVLADILGFLGRNAGSTLEHSLQFLTDILGVIADIADILSGKKTLKMVWFELLEENSNRLLTTLHYLGEAWEALTNLDFAKLESSLRNAWNPTSSDYYLYITAQVNKIEDRRTRKDKRLDFTASITEINDETQPSAGDLSINGITYAHGGGSVPVTLGKIDFNDTVELEATANITNTNDKLPTQKRNINDMTAVLASKTERFNKTTGDMTANLAGKSEKFNKTTGDMTALLSKKSETFGKTTTDMTAKLSKKTESFGLTTTDMTAKLSKKSESFSKTTDGMTAKLTDRTDAIPSSKRTISDVIAYVKSLSKASGFTGLTVSGAVKTKSGNATLTLKKDGGIFSHGFWKNIPQYSSGTLNAGSMFIAGESGAELVGNVGGRTEVLNQSQIAQAMASSMMQANASQNAILQEQNNLLRQLLEKDSTVTAILSTSALADGVARKNRRDGRTVIPVGV